MKFGKRLQAQMYPEWSLYYIHYKRLKQQLKQEYCEYGPFAKLLASELVKVNDFYGTQSRRLVATLRYLTGVAQEGKTTETERLQFRQFCIDVNRLRSYVMLNYMAVIKIVKKWNKRGTQGQCVLDAFAVLQATPFYQSRSLGMLVVRAEMLALCLSPETPLQCKDWSCPICLDILCNPVVLDCGHRFCWSCITTALEQVDQCPVCRKRLMLEHGDLKIDMWLQEFMEHNWPAKDPISNLLPSNGGPSTSTSKETSTVPVVSNLNSVKKEKIRKSLLIGIAGLKTECLLLSKVEGLKKIIGNGKYCMTAKSVSVMSSTNWASILTGVDFTKRTTDHVLDTKGHNFLSTLRKQGYQTAAIGSSKTAHKLLSEASLLSTDKEVYENTVELLSGAVAPDVVFAHFGSLEKTGKSTSFSPTEPAYIKVLEELDVLLTKILEAVQNRPTDEEWMIMLVSEPCSDEDPNSEQEPGLLVVLHPSMEAGEIVPTPHVTDVGPTMLYYFGASSSASLPELDGRCLPLYDPQQLTINPIAQNQKIDNTTIDNPETIADDDNVENNTIEDEDISSTIVSSEHTGAGKLDATQYRSLYSSTLEALKKVLSISETLNQHISVLQKVAPVVVNEESNTNSRKAWSTVIKYVTKQDHTMEYFQDLPAKVASLARQVLRQSCILNRRWTKLSRELEEYVPTNKEEVESVHSSRPMESNGLSKNEKHANGGGGGNRRKNEKGKANNTPPNHKTRSSSITNPPSSIPPSQQQQQQQQQQNPKPSPVDMSVPQSMSPANIAALYAQMIASQSNNAPNTFNDPSIAMYGPYYHAQNSTFSGYHYDPRTTPPGNPTYGHSDPSMTYLSNHPGNVTPPRGFNMYPPWNMCVPNSQ